MRISALIVFFLFAGIVLRAQQTVSGKVTDAATGEALIGAVILADSKAVASCDINGLYRFTASEGPHTLIVKYIGYNCDTIRFTVAGKPLTIDIPCVSQTMKEVEIVADVAVDRKTPIAFSNVSELKIREEGASRDMAMLLNSTPGAYATEQGGGAGDSRVNVRGADQRNVGVMVDGVPMNDMENGQVYWSNWDGLMDVTRTMQVQRGLGASRLAIPSVGGTINILTRGIDQRQSFVLRTDYGSNNMQKLYLGFNSGEFGKGWGITLAGSRRTGEGWADQTWTDQYAYFAKVQKRFGNHLISVSTNAAPQSHGQRFDRMPIGILDRSYAEKLGVNIDSLYANSAYTTPTQGERGLRYNPNWGYINYADGQTGLQNQSINFYSKPLYNLSWFWNISDKLSLSTVTYLSKGYGGGTNFNSTPNRDTLTGQLSLTQSYLSNSSTIDALYSTSETKSTRALLASMNNHTWIGGLTTLNYRPKGDFSYLFGLDARYYKGEHYRMVYDLMGGDYYVDNSDKNQPNGIGNLQYAMKRKGDKVGYWNDSYVKWGGAFAQAEYSGVRWSSFFTITGSLTEYQRVDHFKKRDIVLEDGTVVPMIVGYNEVYYSNGTDYALAQNNAVITNLGGDTIVIDNPSGPNDTIAGATAYAWNSDFARTAITEKKAFPGFTIKTGANYNIDEHYNVFVNVGYMNLAPRFNTVFDNNNKEYPGTKHQKVLAGEIGAGARYKKIAANLNAYYTQWKDKAPSSSPTVSIAGDPYTYDLTGLNVNLMGLELDFNWKPVRSLQVEGLFSMGSWVYQSAGRVYLYDANYVLEDTVEYSAKGVHLGDAAQTQVGAAVRWEPVAGLYIKPRYTFFARNYANFDPIALIPVYDNSNQLIGDNRDRESWKAPSYGLLDINAGYEFKEQVSKNPDKQIRVAISLSVNNVLNASYITDALNGANFNASSALVYMGLGRRVTAGLRFSF